MNRRHTGIKAERKKAWVYKMINKNSISNNLRK
jgi:hypothetical protein